MLLYQAWMNWRLQRALSALWPVNLTEHLADLATGVGGLVVLASGLALALLSVWAVVAFVAGWTVQAGYLLWASRWRRPREALSHGGRRRSLDAFAIYTVATALVIGLPLTGLLG